MSQVCTLVAPELTSALASPNQNVKPTFAFKDDSSKYLGFPVTYMSGSKTCTYPVGKSFTPVFKTGNYAATCSFSLGATASSIICSSIPNRAIPDGTITVAHIASDCDPPKSTTFIVGTSPTPLTDTVSTTITNTITSTITGTSTPYAYTATVTSPRTTTTTTTTSTNTVTRTSSLIHFVNQCPTPPPAQSTTPKSSSNPPYTPVAQSSTPKSSTTPVYTPPAQSSSSTLSPWSSSTSVYTPTPQISSTWTTSSIPTPSPTGKGCPGDNNTVTITPDGRRWILECYVDRDNSDLGPVSATSYEDCVAQCSLKTGCVQASYLPNGPCYLKSDQGYPKSNGNVWGGRLDPYIKATPTISSTTTPSQPTATRPTCSASDGQIYYTSGKVFKIQCGVDHSGGDLSSGSPVYDVTFAGCMDACATTSGCVDVSYSGSACYLKGTVNPTEYNDDVSGAILIGSYDATTTQTTMVPTQSDKAPAPTASGIQCPAANGTVFTSSCGSCYVVECGFDRPNSDLDGNPRSTYTLDDCIKTCDTISGCIDVSWVPGTPGACYVKYAANDPPIYNDNVWGAKQLSGCSSSAATPSSTEPATTMVVKLHRKRFVKVKKTAATPAKVYGGPDYTYGPTPTNVKTTKTATQYKTTATSVNPKPSGTITATVVSGTSTQTITESAQVTQIVVDDKKTVTTCSTTPATTPKPY